MKILVTGASGFVGANLLPALDAAGHSVIATSRHPIAETTLIKWCPVPDFRESFDWSKILSGAEVVIHLAALAHVRAVDSDFMRINHHLTEELGAAAHKAGVKQFVFVSSVAAQTGPFSESVITENDPANPTTAYGRSKLAAEMALTSMEMPTTIFRPVAVSGPNAKGNFRALEMLSRLPIPLPFASLTAKRSIISIDNLVSAILFSLANPTFINETFIAADPRPTTVAEMIAGMRTSAGRTAALFSVPESLLAPPLRIAGIWEKVGRPLVASPQKLISAGWSPN